VATTRIPHARAGTGSTGTNGTTGARSPARAERLDGRRVRRLLAINLGASVAFTAMYSTQAILPQIGQEFGVSPAQAGLTLSAVTLALAFASLAAGRLADRLGARRVMLVCSAALAILSVAVALAPTFPALVGLRALQGAVVPGITVAGLAFLHNDLPAAWRGRVSGFYIAANTIGGLVGRLGVGLSVEVIGWRGGLGLVALLAAGGTAALALGMPRGGPRMSVDAENAAGGEAAAVLAAPEAVAGAGAGASLGAVARRLWWAPLLGGTVFFPFLTLFTYTPYRLESPPFNLSAGATSLIYLVYLLGAVASPLAGQISDRVGRRPTILAALALTALGLLLATVDALAVAALALAVVCVGSLMAHVVANASTSDGANALGPRARATALSLYTFGFYIGGGLGAFIPGIGWERYRWPGVLVPCAVALLLAALFALRTPARSPRRTPDPIHT
jgi:MFS transporter, YNFM family, putative membrane transport protein